MADSYLTKDARGLVTEVVTYLKRDSRDQSAVSRVQALLGKVANQARKERTVRVETSVPMTSVEKTLLALSLKKIIGHDMEVDNVVAPHIIGGMRIQVGDWVVDSTVASQLTELGQSLMAQ